MAIPSVWARARNAARRALSYQRRFGWRSTIDRLRLEWRRRRAGAQLPVPHAVHVDLPQPPAPDNASRPPGNEHLIQAQAPLKVYFIPASGRARITLIIDSMGGASLFGATGTALILGTLLANRLDVDLRIITRTEPPAPSCFDQLLRHYDLELVRESQFRFIPSDDQRQEVDLLQDELVISTSWWTTAAVLPSVPASQVVYLLQEDERMLYAFGDERLRCERILNNRNIRFIVNSELLLRHFANEGFSHFVQRARSFEPAFPRKVFGPRARPEGDRKRLVFDARPRNPPHLFLLGVEIITAAVTRGWLPADEWEIVFVGSDIPEVDLGAGQRPVLREDPSWSDYADLIGAADLGLSLMYTPYPSYPLLGMAASGVVVVTNRFGSKDDLSLLSANLICCDLDPEALLKGLQQGIVLADDAATRATHCATAKLQRDWQSSLRNVLDSLAEVR